MPTPRKNSLFCQLHFQVSCAVLFLTPEHCNLVTIRLKGDELLCNLMGIAVWTTDPQTFLTSGFLDEFLHWELCNATLVASAGSCTTFADISFFQSPLMIQAIAANAPVLENQIFLLLYVVWNYNAALWAKAELLACFFLSKKRSFAPCANTHFENFSCHNWCWWICW